MLAARLQPLRRAGVLPDYPQGSDFSVVEQRLVRALAWLKAQTATRRHRLWTLVAALAPNAHLDDEAMRRMELDTPGSLADRLQARLLRLALARTNAEIPIHGAPTP